MNDITKKAVFRSLDRLIESLERLCKEFLSDLFKVLTDQAIEFLFQYAKDYLKNPKEA